MEQSKKKNYLLIAGGILLVVGIALAFSYCG